MMERFELSIEALRARRCSKWTRYPGDVLPAFVADMDFAVAEPVQAAIRRLVECQDYGYGFRTGEAGLAAAFTGRMRERFGWEVDAERVQTVTELIQAMFGAVMAFSEAGDGVVVQTPIYPPFLMTVAKTGRRLVENPLVDDGTRYVMDIEGLRRVIDDRTRVLLLCNPHNPTGRVFARDELLALGELAVERDLIVVSDEIHADLVYPGERHIPLGVLGPEIAARTITLNSATKGFNIAGLRCAVMHFGSAELQERFRRAIPEALLGQASIVGIDATIAAWREGQPWLDAVLAHLLANRDRIARFVAADLPGVRHYTPEGTYLAWLDCRELALPEGPYRFFLDRAQVALGNGEDFGPPGRGCVRLNFATAGAVLEQMLDRMAEAAARVQRVGV
ncbi:MAG: pyridoxal phosphate-dependent aminotransferase [Chloroflexota bacterium]|nr:pyridoxal phosphate-dependent aminotransferase [Chloroflexota bacterium]